MDNVPEIVNIDIAYKYDGMEAFSLRLLDGVTPIDLSTSIINIPILDVGKIERWVFSTDSIIPEKTLIADANGYIYFPQIKAWQIPEGVYTGDVKIIQAGEIDYTYLVVQFTRVSKPTKV